MVRQSMSRFFKGKFIKFKPEITPGVCPHCELPSTFISIVNDLFKCMHCGEEVKQRINGVIKYLPLGSDKIEEEHGT